MSDANPWIYQNRQFTDDDIGDAFGFVYLIRNRTTDKIYIGKKFFTKASRKTVKGKRKKIRVSSDWQDYYSSCKELQDDVNLTGKENFHREIIRLCYTRGECTYWEAHHQFAYQVLLQDTYNGWISCKVRKNARLCGPTTT